MADPPWPLRQTSSALTPSIRASANPGSALVSPRALPEQFQSALRDLIPGSETPQGFCGSRALLPAARGGFAAGGRRGPGKLPMFARHEYCARARNKWAVRGSARLWPGELKRHPATGKPETGSSGLPVRHLVREFIRVGQTVVCGHGIDLPR